MNMNETEGPNPQVAGIDFIWLRLENVKGEGDRLDRLPMRLMLPHEAQCGWNHGGQTLKTCAERGGFDPVEALAIIEGWNPFTLDGQKRETQGGAYSKLRMIVTEWESYERVMEAWRHNTRRFILVRKEDATGVSGTGVVAHGIEWQNGEMVLHWPSRGGTTALYKSADQLIAIHGHDGKTLIQWLD